MDLFAIIGFALICTVIAILLKQYHPEYSMLIGVLAGIIIFGMVISSLTTAFDFIFRLMTKAKINDIYIKAVIKALGICYITSLAVDCCNDAGQSAIAGKIELASKVFIVLLSLPLFENLLDIATRLIEGKV